MNRHMTRVSIAATLGTVIEWYDFFLYNTAAALVFGKLFFPGSDPAIGTLLAFATSATGFVARPLGALVCGHFGDRIGRKAMLLTTLLTMGLASCAIGLLPTYASIGIAAPLLLVLLRLLQGFATGGEWGGAALLTVEHAQSRQGFWGSFITSGIVGGLVLSALVFMAFNHLPDAQFLAWGWRIPFLLSAVLVVIGLYIRLQVTESLEFSRVIQRGERSANPILEALRQPRSVLVIFLLRVAENFSFYVFSAFALAYITRALGLPRGLALNAVLIAAAAEFITAPIAGLIADRIGTRRVIMFGVAFQALFAFPFFWMLQTRDPVMVVLGVTIGFCVANACISGPSPAYFAGFFGPKVRFSGISIGREAATILGGGLSPLISAALLEWAGASWPIAACMAGTSLLGLLTLFGSRRVETAGVIVASEPERA
jgi:MFS family permease